MIIIIIIIIIIINIMMMVNAIITFTEIFITFAE